MSKQESTPEAKAPQEDVTKEVEEKSSEQNKSDTSKKDTRDQRDQAKKAKSDHEILMKKLPPHMRPKKPVKKPAGFLNNLITLILIFITITALFSIIGENRAKDEEITISELVQMVKSGSVETITIEGEDLTVALTETTQDEGSEASGSETGAVTDSNTEQVNKTLRKEVGTALSETLVNYGVTPEELNQVKIEVKSPSGFLFWFGALAPFLFPIILLVVIIWFFSRQVKGAGMQAFTFGQSKARLIDPKDEKTKVTFKDVAGAKEAKEELQEIVDFLKNPKKFIEIGAQIPKGVLMMGQPGTGKTLLARAVAGEAGVSFFSISGSEFVEMFVGVGASRVRDLFKMAKLSAPAIIFIDEIDAVGRSRGTGVGGGNDEREQTLNQILVEMDGFEPNQKVIVMAATNRPDVLDRAILRPGRFDRRVTIDLPDRGDRVEILKIHARKKPLAEDIDLQVVAQRTPGFSGADLYSLMNEAAILAARESRKKVGQFDLIRSIEKVMLGPERKSHVLSEEEKKKTAYHEAGHALVASVLEHSDPVHKISIISRGNAGGYTLKLPDNDKRLHTKKEFLDDLAVAMGGYVVEKEVYGDLSIGPQGDIQSATAIARDMVTKYGMSDEVGPIALDALGHALPGGQGMEKKEYAATVGNRIDEEVRQFIEAAKDRAYKIITEHRNVLDAIANRLIEVETLERDAYEQILIAHGISVKKREVLEGAKQ